MTTVNESIENAFVDEGFNRIDTKLLSHMPKLKKLKVQWLSKLNLEKIVQARTKIEGTNLTRRSTKYTKS